MSSLLYIEVWKRHCIMPAHQKESFEAWSNHQWSATWFGYCPMKEKFQIEGEKNTRRGGLNCVLKNFSSLSIRTVLRFRVWSSSESEWVQSLVQRIIVKNRERKNTSNYIGSFHKPEVVLSPLHFQGEFH